MAIIKCKYCHLKNSKYKMNCKKRKKVISQKVINYFRQMNKEVHQTNSNLNL